MRQTAAGGFAVEWWRGRAARNLATTCCTRLPRFAEIARVSACCRGAVSQLRQASQCAMPPIGAPDTPAHFRQRNACHSDTLPRFLRDTAWLATSESQVVAASRFFPCGLRTMPKITVRGRSIREKIIGHGSTLFPPCVSDSDRFLSVDRRYCIEGRAAWLLVLLHQPARQHRRGVLLQPRIQQLTDLLSEIGGMTQPRKLVALQRGARCREQELPRRLGPVFQGALQGKRAGNSIAIITMVNSTNIRTYCGNVCKILPPVEAAPPSTFAPCGLTFLPFSRRFRVPEFMFLAFLQACSACSGDYEDPERTAEAEADSEPAPREAPEPSVATEPKCD